jgi:hypothetical protein
MSLRHIVGSVLALLAVAGPAGQSRAQYSNAAPLASVRTQHLARARQLFTEESQRFGQNTNMLVRPGLLADRTSRWVRVYGETVGMNQFVTPQVEFALIAEASGKDYEALAVAFAKPGDIHAALVFIGLHPGHPVDYAKRQFWPKGDRVRMTFEWEGTNGANRTLRAEDLIMDSRTGQSMPPQGFAFVGSAWEPRPGVPGERVYAADAFDPMSVASEYNDPETVLDVPQRAGKGDVYNVHIRNPDVDVPKCAWLRVRLEPEFRDRVTQAVDLDLRLTVSSTNPAVTIQDVQFTLASTNGQIRQPGLGVKQLLAAFEKIVAAGQEPFVTLLPDANLPLSALHDAYRLLASLEDDNGIRIEPPPPGHLYFQAFLPQERLRERANRPVQPLELQLTERGRAVTGELRQIDEIWADEATNAVYTVHTFAVSGAAALSGLLEPRKTPPVLLIFAPPTMTYATLMSFVRPAMVTHPTIYIFLPAPDAAPPKAAAGESGKQ